MFMMTLRQGEAEPLIRCKSCSGPITSTASACVIYALGMKDGDSERVALVHKGPCEVESMAQMENDVGRPAVMELGEYFARFGLGADVKQLQLA